VSDGATSEILDLLAAFKDESPDDWCDTASIDALALFIERHDLAPQAKLFLYRYFNGEERRTP